MYTCPYVPAQWIAAHGLQPHRLIPAPIEGASTIPRIEGLCPYARAFANDAAAGVEVTGIVLTTACDQMRRVFDLLVHRIETPAFLLNVPSTWQTVAAPRLYLDELKRLGRFLVRLGGREPSKEELARIMLDATASHPRDEDGVHGIPCGCGSGAPVAVVGGPLMQRDRVLFDIVHECGGRIVLDATETGQRSLPAPFDRRRLTDDPLLELAQVYFQIPDVSRRPNGELYRWLAAELPRAGARGVILHHYVWCDKWHAEFERLKEWAHLPMLRLDSEGRGEMDSPRVRNRIHAFVETLR
jgi:benzoyl-CoA reductase/2-hydroxyglutaryl-CoA dehydratase subunit BcrC/BadD/HgdB